MKDAIGLPPEALQILYARAYNNILVHQPARSKDLFCLLCALDGTQKDYWLGYGICLHACKESSLALAAFDVAAELAPNSPDPEFHRLHFFICEQRWAEACEALFRFDENIGEDNDGSLALAVEPFRKVLESRVGRTDQVV